MTEKEENKLKEFIDNLNENISDIENKRFVFSSECLQQRGKWIKLIMHDNKTNLDVFNNFRWYTLLTRKRELIYPFDIIKWANDSIISKRDF